MLYIYADGELINNPLDSRLPIFSPTLETELGKSGSLEFCLPPSNIFYDRLKKLKTIITVEMNEREIFRGRILSHERDFNNVRKFYAEGDLSYLVDSVQKPEKYEGTVHALFKKMIDAHNRQVDPEKRFEIGRVEIEDREIKISGQSDKTQDDEGKFDYKQIAINSTSGDWPTTYDYINTCIIEYCGGYLCTRREGDKTYLDFITGGKESDTVGIRFGQNMLDLTEEATAEELFTVLIPLGDENLTIAKVNGGSEELVDREGVETYGRIVKTNVFSNVNKPETLLENAKRFMETKENIPVTFTIRAVDMSVIDSEAESLKLGNRVRVESSPHNIHQHLLLTRIEYNLEDASASTYTFGNPKQALTQRYREDKRKSSAGASGGGGGGAAGGGAAGLAAEEAEKNLNDFFDAWINVDKEHGTISLGALHQMMNNGKLVLLKKAGIDISADPNDPSIPNVNIYTTHERLNEVDGRLTRSMADIKLWSNDVEAKIQQRAAWSEEFEGKVNSHFAELTLLANKNGEAIADLRATNGAKISALTLKVDNLASSVVLKSEYMQNRESDLTMINNNSISLARMRSEYDGNFASLQTAVSDLSSSVVMRADFEEKSAEIIASVNSNRSKITAVADEVELNASDIVKVKAKTVEIEAELTKVRKLIADEISAVKADVSWLSAKSVTVKYLATGGLLASSFVEAPVIRVGNYPVATQAWVKEQIGSGINAEWIEKQDFATKSYVDGRNHWGSVSSGFAFLTAGGSGKQVALGNHTHSGYASASHSHSEYASANHSHSGYASSSHSHPGYANKSHSHSEYCTASDVIALIKANPPSISWSNISGKPSAFKPTSHKHYFTFSDTFDASHSHAVYVNDKRYGTTEKTIDVKISGSGYTNSYGG